MSTEIEKMMRKYDAETELDAALASAREFTIARARQDAEEVSALIVAGKRVPRDLTEGLRNRVRELIELLEG